MPLVVSVNSLKELSSRMSWTEGSFLGRGRSLDTGAWDLDDKVVQDGISSSPNGIHTSSAASKSGESIGLNQQGGCGQQRVVQCVMTPSWWSMRCCSGRV